MNRITNRLLIAALIGAAAAATASAQITLTGTVRDFSTLPSNPKYVSDFEQNPPPNGYGLFTGTVNNTIVPGGKPTYAHGNSTYGDVTNASTFNQWFNTGPNNIASSFNITLHDDGLNGDLVAHDGIFSYLNSAFFPIDGQGFGNESKPHNFGFTYEIHTTFGFNNAHANTFNFKGDDDVWVFINGKLAIDLGGVHVSQNGSVDLNAQAAAFGLTNGNNYALDFFFAERHTTQSTFQIETTLDVPDNPVPEPATYGLIGAGLLGVAAILRRRRAVKA